MNLDARLQWILDNLKQPSGDAWNQKALARAMGLPVWACALRLAAVRAGLG